MEVQYPSYLEWAFHGVEVARESSSERVFRRLMDNSYRVEADLELNAVQLRTGPMLVYCIVCSAHVQRSQSICIRPR